VGLFPVASRRKSLSLTQLQCPALLMTPVITAAMSKLIKVVGSLSYFHVEARVAQRRYAAVIGMAACSQWARCQI